MGRKLPLGNRGVGIFVFGSDNVVGAPGAGNLVSANGIAGVYVSHSPSAGNVAQGTRVGTSADGTGPLGNGGAGVVVTGTAVAVGGAATRAGNTIAYNGGAGIVVQSEWNGNRCPGTPSSRTAGWGSTSAGTG